MQGRCDCTSGEVNVGHHKPTQNHVTNKCKGGRTHFSVTQRPRDKKVHLLAPRLNMHQTWKTTNCQGINLLAPLQKDGKPSLENRNWSWSFRSVHSLWTTAPHLDSTEKNHKKKPPKNKTYTPRVQIPQPTKYTRTHQKQKVPPQTSIPDVSK